MKPKALIIGGTNFIGRNLVDRLLSSGQYELTLFNRGITNSGLFSDLPLIKGDRNTEDVKGLGGKQWDYIIDLSCYYPDSISSILQAFTKVPKRYIFISTCSVYDTQRDQSVDRNESAPVLDCTPEERTDDSPSTYGKRKAECERILVASPLDYIILRPALVYGKFDPTDRFYYWLHQVKKYNEMLIPNEGKSLFSVTYVTDLVEAIIKSMAIGPSGVVYNITSHPKISIAGILKCAVTIMDQTPKGINASSAFLHEQEVHQWTDMPLWIDSDFFTFTNLKIKDQLQMTMTDFEQSVKETIRYYDQLNWPEPKYGMNRDRQISLIQKIND